ncbi:MAG: TlpA disulfide reductase family protein [Acidobacteriota bacterium]
MRLLPLLAAASLIAAAALPVYAQRDRLGIAGQPAPSWGELQWLNLPKDIPSLAVEDFRGKVLYVFCFQSWCPGCHSHGFPTLQEVERHFAGDENVHFVAIQTVFEGYSSNTTGRALGDLEDFGLEIPLAHEEGSGHGPSPFMRSYRTGGTPWTILIGPDGRVAWNGFSIKPEQAIARVEALKPPRETTAEESPAAGAD